jgi:chromosome partitioning protein
VSRSPAIMRRIAIINQKGGVGKTTTSVNLGSALAEQGRRVVVVDLDPQANLSLHLGIEPGSEENSTYTVLHGASTINDALHPTSEKNLRVLPSNIDLSGAELELASAIGRDNLLSDAIEDWVKDYAAKHPASDSEKGPADYIIFDCPPSLGLLSVNALAAANEVLITVQTEFLALMGMSKLVEIVALIQRRLNPGLQITGIAPCLYDSRLRLAREVLSEVRKYFPGQVFRQAIRSNVKLAEAPSFGTSVIEYAPESNGALDYRKLAVEVIAQEIDHPELSYLPPAKDVTKLRRTRPESSSGSSRAPVGKSVPTPKSALPNISAEKRPVDRAPIATEPQVTITPQAPPAIEVAPTEKQSKESTEREADKPALPVDAVEAELRAMKHQNQNLPPLPPEAFEIEG